MEHNTVGVTMLRYILGWSAILVGGVFRLRVALFVFPSHVAGQRICRVLSDGSSMSLWYRATRVFRQIWHWGKAPWRRNFSPDFFFFLWFYPKTNPSKYYPYEYRGISEIVTPVKRISSRLNTILPFQRRRDKEEAYLVTFMLETKRNDTTLWLFNLHVNYIVPEKMCAPPRM